MASTSSPSGHNLISNSNHTKATKTPHLTLLSHMSLPRKVGSSSTAAFDLPVPPRTAKELKVSKRRTEPVRIIATYNMFQRQADNQQLWRRITSYITRDQGPQLAAGGGWTVSLQHVSVSGYLLGAMIEPLSNAQHWITAESRVGAAAVWRHNPVGDDDTFQGVCKTLRLPGLGLTKLVFNVNLWKNTASRY